MANFIDVYFPGLQRVREAFAAAPAIASEEMAKAVAEADELLATQVEAYTEKASGALAASYMHIEQVSETGVIGMVTSNLNYAEPVELGTRPHFPPIAALIDWVVQKLDVPEKDARNVAYLVARKISREGTRPQLMFTRALEQQQPAVGNIFEAALDRFAARLAGAA